MQIKPLHKDNNINYMNFWTGEVVIKFPATVLN